MLDRYYNNEKVIQSDEFNEEEFEQAFEKLFLTSFKPLCFYCQHKFGFDHETAIDTVHSSFVKLWESRKSLYGFDTLKAYIYKVVANNCFNILEHDTVKRRHEKYVLQHSLLRCVENPDVDLILKELEKAIADLPEQMRKVFVLSREKGLKYYEIANLMNISVKTVETQMSRALIRLRRKLKPL